jgi:hypothetical protein
MKVIVAGRPSGPLTRKLIIGAVAIVAAVALMWATGLFGRAANTNAEVTNDKSGILDISTAISALDFYSPNTPQDAATIWAEGVAGRNGLTQYSVMTSDLKDKYLEVTTANYSGLLFPAGTDSIDSWSVESLDENEDGTYKATVCFEVSSPLGEAVTSNAELKINCEDDGYAVSSVSVESALYPFTGIG